MIRAVSKTLAAAVLLGSVAAPVLAADQATLDKGQELAFDRKKGNCLACHMILGGDSAGTIGPPLLAIQSRFDSKEKLREQIYDSTVANPDSAMPPFGRHKVLSDSEIDAVVEYIWTL